jgi:SPP1 gp7 family putative phage head morphogenesis protein
VRLAFQRATALAVRKPHLRLIRGGAEDPYGDKWASWPITKDAVDRWMAKAGNVLPKDVFEALSDEEKLSAFTVARLWDDRARTEVLLSIRDAILEGKTIRQWRADAWDGLANKYGKAGADAPWYRDMVFRTNMQTAYAGGRYASMFAADEVRSSPFWMYSAIHDARTRPAHAALDGRVFRKDDPISRRYLPPLGYSCRCSCIAMDAQDVADGGHKVMNGSDIPMIEMPDGKILGAPPKGFNADRVLETVPRSLANVSAMEPSDRMGENRTSMSAPDLPSPPSGTPPRLSPGAWRDHMRGIAEGLASVSDHEEGVVVGIDGREVRRFVGIARRPYLIEIAAADLPGLVDMGFVHNHPGGGPLTLARFNATRGAHEGDFVLAQASRLRYVAALGNREGTAVLSVATRPVSGWPDPPTVELTKALAEVDLDGSPWAISFREWIRSRSSPEDVATATALFRTEWGWQLARLVAARLGVPYGIIDP